MKDLRPPAAALLALAAGLWEFGAIAEDYVEGDPIVRLDDRIATGLHERARPCACTRHVEHGERGLPRRSEP
jgi:hypothetical protein